MPRARDNRSFSESHAASQRKTLAFAVLAASMILVAFITLTYVRNGVYHDPITLLMDTVKKSPNKDRSHYNLGNELRNVGFIDQAVFEWEKTIAQNPHHTQALNQLGNVWFLRQDLEMAARYYLAAVQADEKNTEAWFNLGMTFEAMGNKTEALKYYSHFLQQVAPDYSDLTQEVSRKVKEWERSVR